MSATSAFWTALNGMVGKTVSSVELADPYRVDTKQYRDMIVIGFTDGTQVMIAADEDSVLCASTNLYKEVKAHD
ncbi:hypothetical protein D1872_51350 [compost metagenome]